jgi:beta-1,4-mannooligosaccharide/beta-1,4-mannosyl-N-acetylglucosamine phosphorylase
MSETNIGQFKSSPIIEKDPANPILKASDVPYNSVLVYNAGVTKFTGRYVMVFRNDFGSVEEQRLAGTNFGLAFSEDGIVWQVEPKPCFELSNEDIYWVNDPRLIVIEDRCFMTFAIIARSGIRGGIAVTEDFQNFEIIHTTLPDNRNLVLFPEKIHGLYLRLDRPFANYLRSTKDSFDIWLSESPDLKYWGNPSLLLKAEDVPFCNDRIGAGPPPLKTERGWLIIFHSVDIDPTRGKNGWEEKWDKRYSAGIMFLDLENPRRIISVSHDPLIAPEEDYEIKNGFRNNVIFPTGIILEDNGEVKIYYGAADTVQCLATAQIEDLYKFCGVI